MTEAQKILLSLVSRAMGTETSEAFPEDEVLRRAVVEESIHQSVCLLVCDSMYENERTQDTAYRTLKKYADVTFKNNILGYEHHRFVSECLRENNIPFVIIKGISSDKFYPKKYLRSIGDVDIFVRPEYTEFAQKVLIDAGFKQLSNASEHHLAYVKERCRVELHYTIGDAPECIKETVDNIFFSENGIVETAEYVDYGGAKLPVCNSYFHGLTLLLHTAGHISSEGIGLRHLCDWAAFIKDYNSESFCNEFEKVCKKLGLWTLAQVLTKAAGYIGVPKFEFSESRADNTAETLIEDIFFVGNMGQKNINGVFSKLNRHDTDKGVEKSKIRYLFNTLNNHVYTHIPAAKCHKLLLLPGYVYVIFRRAWLRLTGQRKRVHIGKSYENAKQRDRFIESLKLYSRQK